MSGSPMMNGLAADTRSLDVLRGKAASDPKAAVREAARQFESLFMNELLKSMRQATPTTGMLDNEGSKMGTEMLDQQLATSLSGLKGGLSEAIARQLERQMGLGNGAASPSASTPSAAATPATASLAAIRPQLKPNLGQVVNGKPQDFIGQHQAAAQVAEQQTGIPAAFMMAQAAHETGWGRKDIKMPDGSSSNNLFGIKAGADWKGPVAEVTTTEFVGGVARKVKASFRAYANAAESFADYAKLMTRSPRYQQVVAQAKTPEGFAHSLQQAGYATDPQYANKLSRIINMTVRLQRTAQG